MISVRLPIAFILFGAFAAARPAEAQRAANLTVGIQRSSQQSEPHPTNGHWSADDEEPNADPYLVIGALVGAGVLGIWEARAVSKNGGDMAGTAGLLWVPPVAGAILGAFGGWLVFKIVHSKPPD